MKFLISILLITSFGFSSLSTPIRKHTEPSSPPSYFGVAVAPYNQFRADYDLLPVQVVGIRGGGPKEEDKFKIEATRLKNQTAKTINGLRLTWFLFSAADLNVALDSRQTNITKIDLKPFEKVDSLIFVVYINQIPLFKTTWPGNDFLLEVAVNEVLYDDGSSWQATDLPRELDRSKMPKRTSPAN